jgi:hypothetical protein
MCGEFVGKCCEEYSHVCFTQCNVCANIEFVVDEGQYINGGGGMLGHCGVINIHMLVLSFS